VGVLNLHARARVVPAKRTSGSRPWASLAPLASHLSPFLFVRPLLKSRPRRRAARLETKAHAPTADAEARVCSPLPCYLPSSRPRPVPHCPLSFVPRSSSLLVFLPSPPLSLSLSLSSFLSIIMLFVIYLCLHRVRFSIFFSPSLRLSLSLSLSLSLTLSLSLFPSAPAYLSCVFSHDAVPRRSRRPRAPCPPAHTNPQVYAASCKLSSSRTREGERGEGGEGGRKGTGQASEGDNAGRRVAPAHACRCFVNVIRALEKQQRAAA